MATHSLARTLYGCSAFPLTRLSITISCPYLPEGGKGTEGCWRWLPKILNFMKLFDFTCKVTALLKTVQPPCHGERLMKASVQRPTASVEVCCLGIDRSCHEVSVFSGSTIVALHCCEHSTLSAQRSQGNSSPWWSTADASIHSLLYTASFFVFRGEAHLRRLHTIYCEHLLWAFLAEHSFWRPGDWTWEVRNSLTICHSPYLWHLFIVDHHSLCTHYIISLTMRDYSKSDL